VKRKLGIIIAASLCITMLSRAPARASGCLDAIESPGCLYGLPAAQYQALLPQMQANPAVTPISIEAAELARYSLFKLKRTNVVIYTAPNGLPIGTVNPGFAFAMPRSRLDSWTEIAVGRWVANSDVTEMRPSDFTGVLLDKPLPFQMAWILQMVKPSALPGQPEYTAYDYLPKHQRVSLYATVRVGDWDWYLIGPGQWVDQRVVGRIVPASGPTSGHWVAVDLYEQVLVAYDGPKPVFATLASSGLDKWPTREGAFAISSMLRLDPMSESTGRPDQYNIPMVPYVMYFDGQRGLHGTFWHNNFGYKASRGCVNLSIGDARWLYDFVNVGTPVIVWRSR